MSDNYSARIIEVHFSPHPDPETTRLKIASYNGLNFIVGVDQTDNVMVLFPAGCQISEPVAAANDLVRRKNEDGSPAGGMLEANRKVKALKLRGIHSEGLLMDRSCLASFGDVSQLNVGDVFEEFNGTPVCKRYVPPYVKQGNGFQQVKKKREYPLFVQHQDTDNLRHNLKQLQSGDMLTVTLKIHGTSGRTSNIPVERTVELPRSLKDKLLRRPARTETVSEYQLLTGSRRVVIDNDEKVRNSFYGDDSFRLEATSRLAHAVAKNEIWFYEIVGWLPDSSTPIMSRVKTSVLKDKEFTREYGKEMVYKYGCPEGTFDVYVYRIVVVNPDGLVYDLPWNVVKARCVSAGLKHVPEVDVPLFGSVKYGSSSFKVYNGPDAAENIHGVRDYILESLETVCQGPDPIDPSHIREGVVIRRDGADGTTSFLKLKDFRFLCLENAVPDDTIDLEEIQSV